MALLFSYGTLQQEDIQLSTFGRKLHGHRDAILRFEPSSVKIEDPAVAAKIGRTHHANATFNGNAESRVAGTVFEVTEAELLSADELEAAFDYVRQIAQLASGGQAWVYVLKTSVESPSTGAPGRG
jgi:gamma-glutamylcyclotransferase (GGCT)/AIG2-like uncharacterized protein YtfP